MIVKKLEFLSKERSDLYKFFGLDNWCNNFQLFLAKLLYKFSKNIFLERYNSDDYMLINLDDENVVTSTFSLIPGQFIIDKETYELHEFKSFFKRLLVSIHFKPDIEDIDPIIDNAFNEYLNTDGFLLKRIIDYETMIRDIEKKYPELREQ